MLYEEVREQLCEKEPEEEPEEGQQNEWNNSINIKRLKSSYLSPFYEICPAGKDNFLYYETKYMEAIRNIDFQEN